MAAFFLSPASQDGKSCFSDIKDEKMEKFLVGLVEQNIVTTKKDIVANYTKATLLDFRRKLFEIAVKKAESSAEDNNVPWDELSDAALISEQKPSLWGLRNRKTKPTVADDAVDLALYIKGTVENFPMQIVRGLPDAEKAGKTPPNSDLEKESNKSESGSSVFDETAEAPEIHDVRIEEVSEVFDTTVEPRVERFVIRETEPTTLVSNEDNRIPVSVTPLCDTGTSTDDLRDIVTAPLRDNGTSTEGLVNLVSSSSQTEDSMFQEADEELSVSNSSLSSFNEDIVERSACNEKPANMANSGQNAGGNTAALDALRERCEKAEAKLSIMEVRHGEEIADVKRDQDKLRADLCKLSNPATVLAQAIPDPVIDLAAEPEFIMTQDSQGLPVMTRESEMHRDLAQREKSGRSNYSRDNSASRKSRMEDSNGRVVASGDAPPKKGYITKSNKPELRVNKPSTRSASARPQTASSADNPPISAYQIITGNAKRWSAKRVNTQITTGSGENPSGDGRTAKKRKVVSSPTASGSSGANVVPNFAPSNNSNRGKTVIVSGNDNNLANDKNTSPHKMYSEVVEDNIPWDTQMSKSAIKKQKKARKVVPPLSGADDSDTKELYLRGLSCKMFKSQKDLEESVRFFCATRNVTPIYHRVIAFRAGRNRVGCKFVVKIEDEPTVRASGFWPKGVSIREWYENPKSSSSDTEESS